MPVLHVRWQLDDIPSLERSIRPRFDVLHLLTTYRYICEKYGFQKYQVPSECCLIDSLRYESNRFPDIPFEDNDRSVVHKGGR